MVLNGTVLKWICSGAVGWVYQYWASHPNLLFTLLSVGLRPSYFVRRRMFYLEMAKSSISVKHGTHSEQEIAYQRLQSTSNTSSLPARIMNTTVKQDDRKEAG
ncbi:hypothetical protein QQP08_003241 [Theobroma cacao]|nr:hypothetical protein QQP08_003241 [Theobroma cacao]